MRIDSRPAGRLHRPLEKLCRATACLAVACLVAAGPAFAQVEAREPVRIVSSAAVFPLAVAASENFSLSSGKAMPIVARDGTERGLKFFCAGVGAEFFDIATVARRMTRAEFGTCSRNRVGVSEILFGYHGVALAQSLRNAPLALTRTQVFLALAKQVPINGKLVANPYKLWSDLDFALPVKPIEVFGPPRRSPLRDNFVELVMLPAAAEFAALRGLSSGEMRALAGTLRDDGAFVELGEGEAEVAAKLASRPGALGIFGFNFLAGQRGGLQGVAIGGVAPSLVTIADGSYSPARALYLYVKPAHAGAIPGLRGYLAEIAGEAASGPGGYLTGRGLTPLPAPGRAQLLETASRLPPLRL